MWKARLAYLFLLPAVGLILLFSYYPAGLAFYQSLTDHNVRTPTKFVGLANYKDVLFHDTYFRTGLKNMAIIVLTSVIKTVTMPLLVAQLIYSLRNSVHQYVFRTLFVLPSVVPDLIFTLMWRQVYDPNTGLLNQLLASVGLARYQRAWLGDERTAIWAIVGVGFPFVSAFAFLIFLGGLLNINMDYFDAAKIDGARWWQRVLHLDLPLLRPQFRILLFFAVVGAIQSLGNVFILTRGGPGTATYVPALQMYLRLAAGDFGYAAAVGVVLFAMILVLTLLILRVRRNDAVES
jgi:ABC-type sugar transport system permease subunit